MAISCGWWSSSALAAEASLADLSLEELSNIEITSMSRRTERLGDAAGSIYVITADAIRRSGATSLPQALRLAPNLQVAQIDASQFAITSRGFNNAIGNKLLVLIDGRTVYTPFFSGVFWDQQGVMLADVDRIEVISGPGGTLWGTNAVNGVINVITRAAVDTPGTLAVVQGGAREGQVNLRFGGALPGDVRYRIYGQYTRRQNTTDESGNAVADGWHGKQIGLRTEWGDAAGRFTLQGDAYEGDAESRRALGLPFAAIAVSGYNLLGRWDQRLGDGSSLRAQAYFDHTRRDDALLYRPTIDVADLELQHSLQWQAQKIVWGGGYRRSRDDIQPGLFFGFHPAQKTLAWKNLFVQDELALHASINLALGIKLEQNDYTGTERLPSARLSWQVAKEQLVWAAWSRAVRAPARLDRDISLPPVPPYLIAGGPDFVSEVAKVAEVGWRATPSAEVSFAVTLFRYDWERLRSGQPPPDAQVQNRIDGGTQGVEAWGSWQALPAWRISAGLTTLYEQLRVMPGSTDPVGPSALGNDPDYQWSLRSSLTVAPGHDLDVAVRRVGALPQPSVPAYTAVDLRWGWHVATGLELALVAQNLGGSHAEFNAAPTRSVIPRSVLAELRWSP